MRAPRSSHLEFPSSRDQIRSLRTNGWARDLRRERGRFSQAAWGLGGPLYRPGQRKCGQRQLLGWHRLIPSLSIKAHLTRWSLGGTVLEAFKCGGRGAIPVLALRT